MGNIEYSTSILGSLGRDSQNSNYNEFGFKNDFGVRVMSVLEIKLLGRIAARDQSEELRDSLFSKYMDKLGVWNCIVKHYSNVEWLCYQFDIFLSQLDIDLEVGTNQNTISDYCIDLQNNSLDFFEGIIGRSNQNDWSEKPLYFYSIILLYKKKFKDVFGFRYEDFNIPFDDIYNYGR